MMDINAAVKFANKLADQAGEIAMGHFRQQISVAQKADQSPVTIADKQIEAFIRESITAVHPSHGILGEEQESTNLSSPHIWVIDPIDGTKSFISGNPLFGNLLGLLENEQPQLGIINIPPTGERWLGIREITTSLNGRPCSTSQCKTLDQAIAYTTDPLMFAGSDAEVFIRLKSLVKFLRFGGDCYSYGLLASGHCDIVVETGLKPYDYLPLVPIIEGAGGVISDWNGEPLSIHSLGRVIAAATPELHQFMLEQITSSASL